MEVFGSVRFEPGLSVARTTNGHILARWAFLKNVRHLRIVMNYLNARTDNLNAESFFGRSSCLWIIWLPVLLSERHVFSVPVFPRLFNYLRFFLNDISKWSGMDHFICFITSIDEPFCSNRIRKIRGAWSLVDDIQLYVTKSECVAHNGESIRSYVDYTSILSIFTRLFL